MTQRNLRGAYYCPTHDRKEDWDFLGKWQPNVIRFMVQGKPSDPASVDVTRVKRLHETCPDATILMRVWEMDDNNFTSHDAMVANPQGEAERQLNWWAQVFDRIAAAGVPRAQLMAGLNNETGPEKDAALYPYTEHALQLGIQKQVRLCVFIFSVGRPSLAGESQYDIPYFSQLDALIQQNKGAVGLNEYMQPEGMYAVWTDENGQERKDWTYLMGRHKRWPIKSDIIISEWGLDGLLYNRHPDKTFGNSGWLNFKKDWPPSRYADEYVEYIRVASDNVIGVCGFESDWNDHKWQSFDFLNVYGELLARKDKCVKEIADTPPVTIHLPAVGTGDAPQPPTGDNWGRAWPIVLNIEGGLSTDRNDRGNYRPDGTFIGTKYGISALAHPDVDIVNLTKEQALDIYKRDYWDASGANDMPFPLCLAVFDLAVNGGVGRAKQALAEAGQDFDRYNAWRLRWYTSLDQFDLYGPAWVRRVATILEASNA